jgi:hypothetical protein
MLGHAFCALAKNDGLVVELGFATGYTINMIANHHDSRVGSIRLSVSLSCVPLVAVRDIPAGCVRPAKGCRPCPHNVASVRGWFS